MNNPENQSKPTLNKTSSSRNTFYKNDLSFASYNSLNLKNINSITQFVEVEKAIDIAESLSDEDELIPTTSSQVFHETSSNPKLYLLKKNHNFNNLTSTSTHIDQSHRDELISLYKSMYTNKKDINVNEYESLDYEICENVLYLRENKKLLKQKQFFKKNSHYLSYFFAYKKELLRWFIIFLIGILTAMTACFIIINVDFFSNLKYQKISLYLDLNYKKFFLETKLSYLDLNLNSSIKYDKENVRKNNYFYWFQVPILIWIISNGFSVFIGSVLVTYLAPVAAGSGIPVIKCYLNGVKVPHVVRIKTYFAKLFGVIFSVVGGLCSGKEGPMIHCGSIIAAGISQGKSTTFKKDFQLFREFREDHEKRDFVSAGAAAGVSAAFGSPVGGLLFSLEEGASFWNQILTCRIFFCTFVSTFTLNFIMSIIMGKIGQLSYSGLINFGKFENVNYTLFEIPIYMLMGITGGLLGALYNFLNYKITIFRTKYVKLRFMKVFEAVFVSFLTTLFGFILIVSSNDCYPIKNLKEKSLVQYIPQLGCKDGEFSTMASLFLNTPEKVVINLFHINADVYSPLTLIQFLIVYFFLSFITYGLSISAGLFIPTLLVGSVIGRLMALFFFDYLNKLSSVVLDINEITSKFALIGAASALGGVVRMTVSLTVILIESTGNITLGLPLMICLLIAKWLGDFFNEGLYDIHISLAKIPFLQCDPHLNNYQLDENEFIYISKLMSTPVVTLRKVEKVRTILEILKNVTHSGFPIVDYQDYENEKMVLNGINESLEEVSQDYENLFEKITKKFPRTNSYLNQIELNKMHGNYGKLRGFVLRWQLIVILDKKLYKDDSDFKELDLNIFRDAYPRYKSIDSIIEMIPIEDYDKELDLTYVMNFSPFTVPYNCSFHRTFRLFRALGLRHLCVINDRNDVVGIITRKDIAQFRVIEHKSRRYIQKYSEIIHKKFNN